ncbi:GGDEF domain-containing protein [Ancylobacter sp. A5.8]|uniref:GGDEF domain-containing protein n=1 Tax=Ancylobacter gelatini TaxID=2919920 RepID=UPI001F4DACD4|nr:GGDEF domain-containing protein [Ancylobacter gelatini]MCJ8141366.1 GGDEF domain-containing protein [Ancylobacter gelatini]
MFYDAMTVWYFATFIMVVLAGVILFSWLFMREEPALGWWGAALVLVILGLGGLIGRGTLPDFVSIELANAVVLLAAAVAWTGFRAFERRLPVWFAIIGVPLAWIALCQLPLFHSSVFNRTILLSVMMALVMGCAVHELWRGRAERMIARTAAIAVIVGHMCLVLLRPLIVGDVGDNTSRTGMLLRDPYLAWYTHEWLAFLMIMSFTVVALVRERRELSLQHASMIDELTGLLNRRGFMARSVQVCHPGGMVALLALDLDRFKAVNDRHGHAGGDRLLVLFADVLRATVRAGDIVARIGGEEFGVLMPDAGAEAALAGAERIRQVFRHNAHRLGMEGIDGTVSIGVACGEMPPGGFPDSVGPLMARADIALYRAKALGRNRVELFEAADSATVVPISPSGAFPRQDRRAR